MKNDHDMDLVRLFAQEGEPTQDEKFVQWVSKRIALERRVRRTIKIFTICAGFAILAVLTPWLSAVTGYIALGSSFFASCIAAVILLPAGWLVFCGLGLSFILKARPKLL